MIQIAIVEDDINCQKQLLGYLNRYETECGEQFKVSVFSDGLDIAEANVSSIDIILMDIQMRNMDGMKAAQRIRAEDKDVIIIFITNLAQYALQGYKVEALVTYIESQDHKVTFHLNGKTVAARDTLKGLEEKLKGQPFARCNNCYLVNLAYVEAVKENCVTVAGERLQISRPKRKGFMEALAAYVGRG